jgi:hypothetical protein
MVLKGFKEQCFGQLLEVRKLVAMAMKIAED